MVSHVQYTSRGLAESIRYELENGKKFRIPAKKFYRISLRRLEGKEKEITMKTTLLTVGALGLSLLGTGCVATHKYVAKTIAPVEQRVSGTEAKNTDQDKELSTHTTEIADLDRDASQTKEKLRDTDAKATEADKPLRWRINMLARRSNRLMAKKRPPMAHALSPSRVLTKLDLSMQAHE